MSMALGSMDDPMYAANESERIAVVVAELLKLIGQKPSRPRRGDAIDIRLNFVKSSRRVVFKFMADVSDPHGYWAMEDWT